MAAARSQCQRGAPHRNGLSSSRVNSSAEPRLVPRAAQLMCSVLLGMVSLLAERAATAAYAWRALVRPTRTPSSSRFTGWAAAGDRLPRPCLAAGDQGG